jgi:hypothetical protein
LHSALRRHFADQPTLTVLTGFAPALAAVRFGVPRFIAAAMPAGMGLVGLPSIVEDMSVLLQASDSAGAALP